LLSAQIACYQAFTATAHLASELIRMAIDQEKNG
jgi:hypothetical protein